MRPVMTITMPIGYTEDSLVANRPDYAWEFRVIDKHAMGLSA
jgi:hypothetical protein